MFAIFRFSDEACLDEADIFGLAIVVCLVDCGVAAVCHYGLAVVWHYGIN